VLRRAHLPHVTRGRVELGASAARHLREVLRLSTGDAVELFDDAGNIGAGFIVECTPARVAVEISSVGRAERSGPELTIASAVPKGERADWMIEKLSELGVVRFIPLAAERSIVLPEGRNKRDRWLRIAIESARQSRRTGVMEIAPLTRVVDLVEHVRAADGEGAAPDWPRGGAAPDVRAERALHLSTSPEARPIRDALAVAPPRVTLLIGPEGGWSADELSLFAASGVAGVRLTRTILRVETASIAAASVTAVHFT
jgi:16S rRNA (uracil1498-N3)-methyltransferase